VVIADARRGETVQLINEVGEALFVVDVSKAA
jgi:hypothetical protein